MSKYKPYRVCPDCGNHLDWGERCDCKDRTEQEPVQGTVDLVAQPAGRGERETILMPGA